MAKRSGSKSASKPGVVVRLGDKSDIDDGPSSFRRLGGSGFKSLNEVVSNQAIAALWLPSGLTEEGRDQRLNAALCAMMEFKPADGIEGMMAAQAVGLHSAAMECLRRAMISDQPGQAADNLRRQGANLSRSFLDVLAALDRKRGKSVRQVVRVERVVVAPGGQAIVGNVQAGGGSCGSPGEGVGRDSGTEEEAHATPAGVAAGTTPPRLAHDPAPCTVLPPMRGVDPGRDALPISSDAERALPDAWGLVNGA